MHKLELECTNTSAQIHDHAVNFAFTLSTAAFTALLMEVDLSVSRDKLHRVSINLMIQFDWSVLWTQLQGSVQWTLYLVLLSLATVIAVT